MPRAGNAGEPPGKRRRKYRLRYDARQPPSARRSHSRHPRLQPRPDSERQLSLVPVIHRLLAKNMSDAEDAWAFEDAPNVACFTVRSIMSGAAPILQVFHDEDDGAWQMLPGSGADASEAMIVGLGQLVQVDQTLVELANLPLGWVARRERKNSPWLCRPTSQPPAV